MSGYVLAVISDTHFGGNTAVAPPQFEVHNRNTLETQTMMANRLQSWLTLLSSRKALRLFI